MGLPDRSRVFRLADARARIPGPAGEHAAGLWDRGTLKVKLSCPVRPNQQTPHTQDEVYVIVRGTAKLKLDDEILELEPWDAVRIAPGVVRDIEGGPDGAELILFGAPRVPPGDAVTEQDWWTD